MQCATCVVLAALGSGNIDDVKSVVERLEHRLDHITNFKCEYNVSIEATDVLIQARAKADGRTLEAVRTQYDSKLRSRLIESRAGQFLFEVTRYDRQGNKGDRRLLTYDGHRPLTLQFRFIDGEELPPTVYLNDEVRTAYESEALLRQILGDTLLAPLSDASSESYPLHGRILRGRDAKLLQEGASPGGPSDCFVISWSEKSKDDRYTIWLSRKHELVPMRYKAEVRPLNGSAWVTTREWSVNPPDAIGSVTRAKGSKLYYPTSIVMTDNTQDGTTWFTKQLTIETFSINGDNIIAAVSPVIEDGSNVLDLKSKSSYVSGRRMSPRLAEVIKRQVQKSKQAVGNVASTTSAATPPRSAVERFGPWLGLSFGVAGLAIAVILRRKV